MIGHSVGPYALPVGPETLCSSLSGKIWVGRFKCPARNGNNGYFILAKQYIAAVLNQENGACVPSGVANILTLATAWFGTNTQGTPKIGNGPSAIPATGCEIPSECGTQKDWGCILEKLQPWQLS